MKFLYFVFVAVCVVYTSLSEDEDDFGYTDLRLDLANQSKEGRIKCARPGLLCSDCNRLVNCVEGEDGGYEEILVQICTSGQTCLRDHCTSETNPVCVKDYTFECTATGVFPDPFNCRKYHYCVVAQSDSNNIEIEKGTVGITSLLCDEHHSYDPITTYCKANLTDGCPDNLYPVPICKTSGQTGAISNKSIYYVCVVTTTNKLIPKLYVCPHGKIYTNSTCA